MSGTSSLVSNLQSTASSFSSSVNTQATKLQTALNKIDTTVNTVNRKMIDLRKMIIEGEEKQIAHENVLKIEQQIDEQLKTYQQTRTSVLGVIKDFDINLARGSTITKLSEELWMSSSRYWLSYAFIALSAWIQDDKELCENAVAETVRRDPARAALFFCLVNLRFHRNLEAREWLYEFFSAVDPLHPLRETALLIQAYIFGVFSKDPQLDSFMQATMNKWSNELTANHGISEELSDDYMKYVSNLPTQKPKIKTDALGSCCENLGEFVSAYEKASRYEAAIKRVNVLDKAGDAKGTGDFVAKIDKLLDNLVTSYEDEEIRLRNEQKFYKFVMKHEGNVEAAKKEYEVYMEAEHESTSNIGKQMFRWAVYPDGEDLSVQKYAMQKTMRWYEDAVNNYDRNVRNEIPNNYKLKIGIWSDAIDGKDREAVKTDIKDKYLADRSKTVIFTKTNIILAIIAVVGLIVGCLISVIGNIIYGYIAGPVIFVLFGAIVGILLASKLKEYPKLIAKAQAMLDACLDEIAEYKKVIEEELEIKEKLIITLRNL